MQIIYGEYPPNYKAITKTFKIEGRNTIVFTYGDTLYIPSGNRPDKPLMRHEETHARQQLAMGIESWWARYLADSDFRFMQELEAYRNQYRSMAELPFENRIGYLNHIATDLAGPMYGDLMTVEEAKTAITDGIILKGSKTHKHKNIRKLKKRQRQNRKRGRN